MASIHPDTQIGLVALTVADLDRSIRFYEGVLGFKLIQRRDSSAALGVGQTPLLVLAEQPGARPKSPYTTGLYHFAILVPSRADLARSLRLLAEMRHPLGGSSDHLVSEALYLSDPDGNGIEIYRDRPRSAWPIQGGQVQMAVDPLDLEDLLAELERDRRPWQGLAPGTRIGHIHLQVADLRQAEAFYHGVLGFDVMQHMPGALFVSAGGYHHHIGLNTWHTRDAPPPPAGSAGLRHFTISLPDATEQARLAAQLQAAGISFEQHDGALALLDPWGNRILLTVDPTFLLEKVLAVMP